MDKDIIFKFDNREINFTELFAIFFSLSDGEKLIVEDVNPIGIIKVKVTESKEPIKPKTRFDDEVDDSLLRLAGLKD